MKTVNVFTDKHAAHFIDDICARFPSIFLLFSCSLLVSRLVLHFICRLLAFALTVIGIARTCAHLKHTGGTKTVTTKLVVISSKNGSAKKNANFHAFKLLYCICIFRDWNEEKRAPHFTRAIR